jgi:hypothetical protein
MLTSLIIGDVKTGYLVNVEYAGCKHAFEIKIISNQ